MSLPSFGSWSSMGNAIFVTECWNIKATRLGKAGSLLLPFNRTPCLHGSIKKCRINSLSMLIFAASKQLSLCFVLPNVLWRSKWLIRQVSSSSIGQQFKLSVHGIGSCTERREPLVVNLYMTILLSLSFSFPLLETKRRAKQTLRREMQKD